jgi:exosortase/archaeosortase family protein
MSTRATQGLGDWLRLPRGLHLRFALTYAAIAVVLFSVYAFPYELCGGRGDWLSGYLSAYAHLAGSLLRVFDSGVTVDGAYIQGRFSLQIVRNCDAADVNILFVSAVAAFPSAPAVKPLPLAAGLIALVFANVLRICSLYCMGAYAPDWFRSAHEEIWPALLVAIAVVIFLVCVRHMQPQRVEGAPE